jgi:hypothetical protein
MKYGIENGQIYLRADCTAGGVVVEDAHTFADMDDVLVRPFGAAGVAGDDSLQRLDCFKLAMVRYIYTGVAVRG